MGRHRAKAPQRPAVKAAHRVIAVASVLALGGTGARAVQFTTESGLQGSFDSTISLGAGVRTQAPAGSLISPVYSPDFSTRVGGGSMGQFSGVSDQGDIDYARGDLFTGYLKGSHELLLKAPEQKLTFMLRANWLRDFAATHTTGASSGQDQVAAAPPAIGSDGLSDDARKDMRFKARLLDLWVSKTLDVGDRQVRVRVGNQVVSWGESLYEIGGINATNSIDINRASQPGTQVKELVLPAPIASVAAGLGNGIGVEAYVQTRWNASYLPPVGSYWSTGAVGTGSAAYGARTEDARRTGQWGLALRYQPAGSDINVGLYAMNYHDKLPQVTFDANGATVYRYAEDRRMYGVSANFPVGDWAVGTEISYRPRDAVSLNPASGCVAQNGNCYVDERRWQWHLSTLLALTPSNADTVLKFLGADTATLTTETVAIVYPGLKSQYAGSPVAAGGWLWGNEHNDVVQTGALNSPGDSVGTSRSGGINIDFNWIYDGTIVPGWQVNPGLYIRRGLFGRTPNVTAQFMQGVTAMNFYVNFVQNPAHWQAGLNYTRFSGGKNLLDNPLRDRDFVGVVVSRNF